MTHEVGPSLFEEIAELRAHLRAAYCVHGSRLTKECCARACISDPARELLRAEPGAKAKAVVAMVKP